MYKFERWSCRPLLFLMIMGLILALPATAEIVPVSIPANGPGNQFVASGQGYGTIYVLVDLQWSIKSASSYTEEGYAAPNANMTCVAGVCSKVNTGVDETNQERVYTLAYVQNTILGGTGAANLFFLFNISQQGSNDKISMNNMQLIVYDGSFNAVQTFTCTADCFVDYAPIAGNGQGTAGYGFHLTSAQAAILDNLFADHPEYYLGGFGSFGDSGANANDGSDNIALVRGNGVVPEPASMLMLGSGILVAAGAFRRRFL